MLQRQAGRHGFFAFVTLLDHVGSLNTAISLGIDCASHKNVPFPRYHILSPENALQFAVIVYYQIRIEYSYERQTMGKIDAST